MLNYVLRILYYTDMFIFASDFGKIPISSYLLIYNFWSYDKKNVIKKSR